MDERRVRELLARAAGTVAVPDDLSVRAEQRYRRRRNRTRVLAGVLTVGVLAVGVAAAAIVGTGRSTGSGPTISEHPSGLGAVNVRSFGSLAFVDATTGYGVAFAGGRRVLAKTED